MKAIVIAETDWDEEDLRDRLVKQIDDFDLVLVDTSEHTLFYQANAVVKTVKDNPSAPVFVVVTNPMFAAIISAKLAQIKDSFQVMEWKETRFKVLKIP